ncbi:substrate-binding periplasmic protein [Colwellia psychrerythraea]|uniref:ABC-type transporter, periplasmic subunit family 3 n=1 Tax=Colwellia psychrerythraea TaxID=28229 RepID=A0A099L3Y1_COLPS|nr:transporter substrate-binding domain-containing protein [Colwellia psychrerythraea]KGJ96872.1 ABC-type transporter, periplasmic subunit family 3 [Colwellia psychrerythraea]
MHILKIASLILLFIATSSKAATEINYMVIQDQAQPFQNHQNKKHHTGIITDIVKEIFSSPEYELKIHTLPFNRMISMLEKGDIENWITFGSPNWPGVQSANLSKLPVFNVQHSLLTSTQQDFDINSAEDLFGKTVILLHGFNYPGLEEHIAEKRIKAISVKNYKSAFKVVNRLKDKAGFVEMDVRIKYNLKKEELATKDYNLHNFSKVIENYDLHLAMSPKFDKELQRHLEESLDKLYQTGNLEKIIEAY